MSQFFNFGPYYEWGQGGSVMTQNEKDSGLISLLKQILGPDSVEAGVPLTPERHEELKEKIRAILATLTPREEKVLRMRFGIGEKPNNIEEVGKDFFVTRERVRQIEAKALKKLSHPTRQSKIRAILDGDSVSPSETSEK